MHGWASSTKDSRRALVLLASASRELWQSTPALPWLVCSRPYAHDATPAVRGALLNLRGIGASMQWGVLQREIAQQVPRTHAGYLQSLLCVEQNLL